MNAKRKLKNALIAIDNAKRKINRIGRHEELDNDLSKILRDLREAEIDIERSIRDLD